MITTGIMANVFSDYEITKIGFKTGNNQTTVVECIGSAEESMTSRTITKKCRGVTVKSITKGTGEGTLKVSLHLPYQLYLETFGMTSENLATGVNGYGQNSKHIEFTLTAQVLDEDGTSKYKAYPKCCIATKPTVKIENGSETVAEIETEITIMPDEYGYGMYECLVDEVSDTIKNSWISNFTTSLVTAQTNIEPTPTV